VSHRKDDRGGRGSDCPEVMSEPEHRPVIAYRAEASVESVGKPSVVDELCADSDVGSSLESCTNSLFFRSE
jgi:hypothetical protein